MKICTVCKQVASDDAVECPHCGHAVIDPSGSKRNCGTQSRSLSVAGARPRSKSSDARLAAASNAMTQHTKAVLMSGACVIASIAFFLIWGLSEGMSGGSAFLVVLACFSAVKVIMFVSAIAFIVQGFRVHWGWGVANMFLGPLAGIVFFFN